jgi:flagellar hook assembly protein FlgD
MGSLIKTLNESIYTDGYRSQQIEWNGTTDGGAKIMSGTYVYALKVSLPGGETVQQSSKLVVLR